MTRTHLLPAPLHGTATPLTVVEAASIPTNIDFETIEARKVQPGGGMAHLSADRARPILQVASWLSAAWILMATPTVAEPSSTCDSCARFTPSLTRPADG
ncbi:hypothetical protein B1B08_12600 (plasmid) [Cutibacterium acnes subsp. defendens]|nr:hypothetical protein [Cutibacterium acnes]PGF24167.1 hypothetical protein B1B08_12600 [Cutibacterium acnes subsp. defendens]